MDKTIVVGVQRKVKHPVYGKFIKKVTKIFAHDEGNLCNVGDIVLVKKSAPFSRKKNWVLIGKV
jgi:small subunit ribosomal protein S17